MTSDGCEHFSILSRGDIVCELCGAVRVIDCSGPAHWQMPIVWPDKHEVLNGMTPEEMRGQFEQHPFPEPTVADCRKGSCQRHGRCMYLNHQHCPIRMVA